MHGRDPPRNPNPAAAAASTSAADGGGDGEGDATTPCPSAAATDGDGVTLYTANCGDCRAVLCRGGAALRLSEDHKPNSREEKSRVERAGGCVINVNGIWRVCTSASAAGLKLDKHADSLFLSTSRAFGDRKLKRHGELVSAIPEVTAHRLQWADLFFVLACDGVWDVLSDQQVVDLVAERLGPRGESPQSAAAAVVRAAYDGGSLDNVTATVVQFGWHERAAIAASVEAHRAKVAKEEAAKAAEIAEEEIDMFA